MGFRMDISGETIVTIISLLSAALCTVGGWVWSLARKVSKYEVEHASHGDDISTLTREMREMRQDQQKESNELRQIQREERHQLSKMSSKIDVLLSVIVSKNETKLNITDVMEMLDKQGVEK